MTRPKTIICPQCKHDAIWDWSLWNSAIDEYWICSNVRCKHKVNDYEYDMEPRKYYEGGLK